MCFAFRWVNPSPADPGYAGFANSVDPDQLASEEANWSRLHCLPFSMWIYFNNLDQGIWLADC